MDEYLKLLILSYFKQYNEQYILSDLIKILGIDIKRLDKILIDLLEGSLIEYNDGLLALTQEGRRVLIRKEMDNYYYDDSIYLNSKIDASKAWPTDKPYVPLKFLTKI